MASLTPVFFDSAADLRRWLAANHDKVTELLIGFYKRDSGKGGITYHEALDEALCVGWIDGVRKRMDDERFTIRFTPRKAKSIWSQVNIRRANDLIANGRMKAPGRKAFDARDEKRTMRYSFENRPQSLEPAHETLFKANETAWGFFEAQPPGYRRTAIWYVMSAVREETKLRRLSVLIDECAQRRRLSMLTPPSTKPDAARKGPPATSAGGAGGAVRSSAAGRRPRR